jgi:N,N'-diacetyllegionaminate synthase
MHAKIIAEVAQGYEGSSELCDLYVRAAAKAGADVVKFQVVYADDLSEPGHEYYDLYKKLELGLADWQDIRENAKALEIGFVVDIFGTLSLDVARSIRPDGIKIHASDFFNRDLLREAFNLAPRVFVSVGGIDGGEIDALINAIWSWGKVECLTILTGFQAEPPPIGQSNLNRLTALRRMYPQVQVGYLDHAEGASPDKVHLSIMAIALGADWIEKHLTLSRFLEMEDYVSALEPEEFAEYTETLRRLDKAYGDANLGLSDREREYRDRSVKKLLAARDLPAGHQISAKDVIFFRSGRIDVFEGFHDPADVIGHELKQSVVRRQPFLAAHLS